MKRRLFALMMACILVVFGVVSAFAEGETATEEATEINWADFEEQLKEAGTEGKFVTFDEIAVTMRIPSVLLKVELTEEDAEDGYIAYYMTEDESAAVGVMYVDVDGMELEEYAELLPEYGASEIEYVVLNGLPAISYQLEEDDTMAVAFVTEAGYILEVSFAPISDEGFAAVAIIISASIQAAE